MVLRSPKPDVIIPEVPFADYILKACYSKRDKIAIVDAPTGREFTFGDVADQAVRCASALSKMGLRKGDVVATCASNSPEYFIAMLAVTACGGIVTTCNPLYTADEITRQFQHSQPKVVFCVPGNLKTIRQAAKSVPSLQRIYTIGEVEGVDSYSSLIRNESGNAFPHHVEIDVHEDIAFLPYSSGTTGLPKGVMLTHYNMIAALFIRRVENHIPTDCVYSCLPLFHISGLLVGFICLDEGIKHVLDNRMDLRNMFASVQKFKVTEIIGVPPILLAIEKSPLRENYNLSSLKNIFSGAAPLSPQIAESLSKKVGCSILQAWGLTEVCPATANNPLTTPHSSVGSTCPSTKIMIVDVETGKELGPNQNGEILVKGPQVMKGYFKNPEATIRTIDADGWMHTGDIGHYDENEMIYIVDRLKELIKYKGFQVAPAEIESILLGHSKILDAAVIGIPDKEAGELPKAFIVKKDPSLTADEINNFIQGKLIKYKHLNGGIEFCSSIPKNPSGKVLRRELRKRGVQAKM